MSAGVASIIISCRLNKPPSNPTEIASSKPTASVVPATILILSGLPAPKAWPISTVAPVLRPITKANRKKNTGKNVETAASASTPIMCPR
jgi:hypothetical protein